jgi:tRNA (guanine37-N1)-methyltransferase
MLHTMNFHVVTLFPESFDSYMKESIIGRAITEKKIKVSFYNIRKYAPKDLRKKWPDGNVTTYIDGRPFGGGPGMVMRAEPIALAMEAVLKKIAKTKNKKPKTKILFFSPSGSKFSTAIAKEYTKKFSDIVFICGRYEGIDARIRKIFKCEDISIGDYVLTGGELPAMVLMDCMARQIPGVLGNFDSREEERIASSEVYTRPDVLIHNGKKYKVPPVLLSGHQKKIEEWKQGLTK